MGKYMPVETTNRNREITIVLATSAVLLGAYALIQNTAVQDWWKGRWYSEPVAVNEIRQSLELTGTGERIFLATQPALESAEEFNNHCDSHKTEVSLLGCYTDDKIYIYNVQEESLHDSNKVTAAHELLHAAWARLSNSEREDVTKLLQQVQRDHADWVKDELSLYQEAEQTEELYTRVGTKLRDIPDELERHYAKYFSDRLKIVEYYESYQAPFNELKDQNTKIREGVLRLNAEIMSEQADYNAKLSALDQRIKSFNQCAETEGCFTSRDKFESERMILEAEKVALDNFRNQLNAKIDKSNALVQEYQQNQAMLGELQDALNSNLEKLP